MQFHFVLPFLFISVSIYFVAFFLKTGIGLVCCLLRIFFCICPSNCISSKRRKLKDKNGKVDADHTTSLLCADNKRISIAKQTEVCGSPFFSTFQPKCYHELILLMIILLDFRYRNIHKLHKAL